MEELLLELSCPAFTYSSLPEVMETFTDKEPERNLCDSQLGSHEMLDDDNNA